MSALQICAGRIAALARDGGAAAVVHVTALGAETGSPVDYNRTKAEGEAAVLAAFPGATILRRRCCWARMTPS